ncbi:MAG: hypothetical protein U9P49_05500 [Thermodesulfobacteriota bacterium]|nr:hypothetical protein [Thermodesulfobacteriota bacterium]
MKSIQIKSRVGKDGILRLQVPADMSDQDLGILLVVQPVTQKSVDMPESSKWPADFFKVTAGAFKGMHLKREAQGGYEIREPMFYGKQQ